LLVALLLWNKKKQKYSPGTDLINCHKQTSHTENLKSQKTSRKPQVTQKELVVVSPSRIIIINEGLMNMKKTIFPETSIIPLCGTFYFEKEIFPGIHHNCMVFNLAHGGIAFFV
jgi:hypothetical protein